ncbi:MAG: BTAD domain-containing putative transcriptional regulator [Gemmatimonadota bacterium]
MLRLFALGELRLTGADARLSSRRKQLALLLFLARRGERGASRAELGALLWGERPEEKARQSLRQALVELRQILGDALEVGPTVIRLVDARLQLDVAEFEVAAAAGHAEAAIMLWRGEFLADAESLGGESYRDWIDLERRTLHERFRTLLDQTSWSAEQADDWERAARYAQRWAEVEPYAETPHRRWCRALQLTGRLGEARGQLAAYRERISEFNAEPSAELIRLAASLSQEPKEPRPRQSSAAVFAPDLVGRESILTDLLEAWRASAETAVVILLESDAGLGKTRLCDEFVRRLSSEWPEAVILKGSAETEEQSASVAAAALSGLRNAPGLSGASDHDLAELAQIVPAIRGRFEHLPASSGDLQTVGTASARVLRDVAAEARVLVLIDNFDNADALSRTILLSIASVVNEPGLMVLCTSGDAVVEPAEIRELRMLSRTRRIRLQALDLDATTALVASMLGSLSNDVRSFIATLHTEAGGNPLFVREILLGLVDEGHLHVDAKGSWKVDAEVGTGTYRLPRTVRQIVTRRLQQLDDAQHRVAAAVATQHISTDDDLARSTGLHPHEIRTAVDELIARRLLRRTSPASPTLSFTHELIRRVAIELLLPLWPATDPLIAKRALERQPAFVLKRVHWPAAVATVALVAIALLYFVPIEGTRAAEPGLNTVVVFPFEMLADSDYHYLGDGLVDLISFNIDRAGDVRAISPRTVFSAVKAAEDNPEFVELARGFGAGRYVTGTVLLQKNRLRITAYINELSDRRNQPIAETVEGPADSAFALAARLSVGLLTRLQGGLHTDVMQSRPNGTSLPALKAYLSGEREFRAGRYPEAVQAFREAIAADSTLALAYYRLAFAAEWIVDDSLALWSARQAARHARELPDRPRRLIEGFLAWREGDAETAERLYKEVLRQYPRDAEALYNLGEVLFHLNPMRGRSILEARLPFEGLLATEPANGTATTHLSRIALAFKDADAERTLVRRFGRVREPDPLWMIGYGTKTDRDTVLARVSRSRAVDLAVMLVRTAVYTHNLEAAAQMAALIQSPERTWPEQQAGHLYSGVLAIAAGQVNRGLALLTNIDENEALPYKAVLASAPHLRVDPAILQDLRMGLESWQPKTPLRLDLYHQPLTPNLAPPVRAYLQGRLSIALGDVTGVRAAERKLAELSGLTEEADALRRVYRAGMRAGIAWLEGRLGDVLIELQRENASVPPNLTPHAFASQAFERFIRARALQHAGRSAEALNWYRSIGENSLYDLIYLAPATFHQAEIHQAGNDSAAARADYDRSAALWQNADLQLRAFASTARNHSAQLDRTARPNQ